MYKGKDNYMEKYIPVKWFLDTNTILRRHGGCYMEEFSVLNKEVPKVYAIPAEDVKPILNGLRQLGGYEELIGYLEFLLKEDKG